MLTVKEVLLRTTSFFEGKGIENPRLNAEILLAHGLGMNSRLDVYLQHDRPLEEAELEKVRPLVKRRVQGEPLQHIEGRANFLGEYFLVNKKVLIPRPETEELFEKVEALLNENPPNRILDLGTGSGILALSLARTFKDAKVIAVDISPDALAVAKENAELQNLSARIKFLESDWYAAIQGEYDLIISNPPYLTDKEVEAANPEVRDFEPMQALVSSGEKGEDCLFQVLEGAIQHLVPQGVVAMETGIFQHDLLYSKATEIGYSKSWGEKDLSGRDRFFFAQK
jgi:release factor glutamine methyltransferase